jgi:membrane-bound lytic murein transglycosylase B
LRTPSISVRNVTTGVTRVMYGDLVHELKQLQRVSNIEDGRVRIAGLSAARPALSRGAELLRPVHRQTVRATRTPAFGVAVILPLIFAGAVGAAAPRFAGPAPQVHDTGIIAMAAVASSSSDRSGPSVVAVKRPPASFHIAQAATASAPPPAVVVNTPGTLGIPAMALSAYRNAERIMAGAYPACGVSWNLLAGIGRIESMHANGGATDARGTAVRPIYGPALDGTLPGNEVIVQSGAGGRVTYARAMGPMQFLPGTWSRYASDGDGDGKADPQNLYDSTLAAARYLCSGGLNLRDPSQVLAAILRYNNSMPYARNVVGWAAAYATGVVPIDLPPLTGPAPPIADSHLERAEGLGPNLPFNMTGLPPTDPLAQLPLIDFGPSQTGAQPALWPGQPPAQHTPSCAVFCIVQPGQTPAAQTAATPPWSPPWLTAPTPEAAPPGLPVPPPEAAPGGPLPGPPPASGPRPGPPPTAPRAGAQSVPPAGPQAAPLPGPPPVNDPGPAPLG